MSIYDQKPIDRTGLQTIPLAERPAKVTVSHFAGPYQKGQGVPGLLDSLPRILAGNSFRDAVEAIWRAWEQEKPVLWGLGGHVIKVGLGPILIDLMERGFVTGIAMNGSTAIHDFEVALVGSTSEEVDATLPGGRFGMAEETGAWMNQAIAEADQHEIGMGEGLGEFLLHKLEAAPGPGRPAVAFPHYSLLLQAYRRRIPVTVHVAIGTDTPHNHPAAEGRAIGGSSYRDFLLFAGLVRGLEGGGVYLNVGSAVILPEVFLKAVSAVRNLGNTLRDFTTVNMDFLQHYRPLENVVRRPTLDGGRGYALTGHHEILVPLLAAALIEHG
ncbi:MAG: hypothetical protein A3J28_14115 [Acidobacteria bacterium RIFCSPLOWO2_12_FULL_60_22]|nr:MAG: hypothetical protein A3J28_14115 [Acidobacteria bacterium RIFCSPLOWO2_12_FULL_60_22]